MLQINYITNFLPKFKATLKPFLTDFRHVIKVLSFSLITTKITVFTYYK